MRTIIAGCRNITDPAILAKAVTACPWKITFVVNGGAAGVDTLAVQWAAQQGIMSLTYSADWSTHGKAAGPIRNRAMARDAAALLAIWDGKSRGTANMIEEAKARGLKVCIFRVDLPARYLDSDLI